MLYCLNKKVFLTSNGNTVKLDTENCETLFKSSERIRSFLLFAPAEKLSFQKSFSGEKPEVMWFFEPCAGNGLIRNKK